MLRTFCRKPRMLAGAGWFALPVAAICLSASCHAHHPDYANMPVHQRVEPIPSWLGNFPSYRERYNRPTYVGGKIAYWIEPSSQEAMSWHRSVHRGYYANHAPRMEDRYFYQKPWQALAAGPRMPKDSGSVPPRSMRDGDLTTGDAADGILPPTETFDVLPEPMP